MPGRGPFVASPPAKECHTLVQPLNFPGDSLEQVNNLPVTLVARIWEDARVYKALLTHARTLMRECLILVVPAWHFSSSAGELVSGLFHEFLVLCWFI